MATDCNTTWFFAPQNGEVQTLVTTDVSTTFRWSFGGTSVKEELSKAECGSTIISKTYEMYFTCNDEMVTTKMFFKLFPNGGSTDRCKEGMFQCYLHLAELPQSKYFSIEGMKLRMRVRIEELKFDKVFTNDFDGDSSDNWGCWCVGDILLNEITKLTNGFDLVCDISLKSIQVIPLTQYNYGNNINDTSKNGNGGLDNSLIQRMDKIEAKLDEMMQILLKNKDYESKENQFVNENKPQTYLESWILQLFSKDIQTGQKYVNLIVKKEGFEDIETLSQLTENDFKEMGIDKKGHRIKILQQLKQEKEQKFEHDNGAVASQFNQTEGDK